MVADAPPLPENGGSNRDFLQRIERRVDQSERRTTSMWSALFGDPSMPWDNGRLGRMEATAARIEKKLDDYIASEAADTRRAVTDRRSRVAQWLSAASVVVVAIGVVIEAIITARGVR